MPGCGGLAAVKTHSYKRGAFINVGTARLLVRAREAVFLARLVMKFGGTSVADLERIRHAAAHVAREVRAGHQVAVVVSAMAGQTDHLVSLAREAALRHDMREYDSIVAAGEQVTSGLLAIVLQGMGISARSWLGWQVPVRTDGAHGAARILEVAPDGLRESLNRGEVAVVAGFQGIADDGRIATLGRGGSDTSAVAVAAALKADRCDIYTDVDGVYTTDPRIVPKARRISKISYEEMLEMASLGAKVLQTRSVELAMVHGVPLQVRSSFVEPDADPGNDQPGTLVCDEGEIMEKQVVTSIAYARDDAKVTLLKVADKPGIAARVFGPLAAANINVDMIVQNVSEDGRFTDLTFTVPAGDLERTLDALATAKAEIGYSDLRGSEDVAKLSIIGVGMRSHAGVAAEMFRALAEKGINIEAISTSEIKVSVLIDADYAELGIRTLHSLYGLDAP
jgi:aspartate kinase